MKTIRNIVSVVIALVLTLTLFATASADNTFRTLDEIKASGVINIGVFSDKNPFGYVDENGDYQGYDVYFANRIGEDLGVKVNFVSTEAANRVEYLETYKVDIILANFTVTLERAEKVDFALPYMNVALGVVSPDNRIILLEDRNILEESGPEQFFTAPKTEQAKKFLQTFEFNRKNKAEA